MLRITLFVSCFVLLLLTPRAGFAEPPAKENPAVDKSQQRRSKLRQVEARSDELLVLNYSVADLVVPPPGEMSRPTQPMIDNGVNSSAGLVGFVVAAQDNFAFARPRVNPDFDDLIQLITGTIQPNTWDRVGGRGLIRKHEVTLSLVIWQTQAVHDEIADLLDQLRRLLDRQVSIEIKRLRIPEAELPILGDGMEEGGLVLKDEELKRLLEKFSQGKTGAVITAPKLTLFDGQTADLVMETRTPTGPPDAGSFGLKIHVAISSDDRTVRVKLAVPGQDVSRVVESSRCVSVPANATVLCDVTRLLELYREPRHTRVAGVLGMPAARELVKKLKKEPAGPRELLLLTPRIVIAEEEELLGIELKSRK